MGDLHAAIAASPRAKTGAGEARIRKSRHDPYLVPWCRIGGAAIEDDDKRTRSSSWPDILAPNR